MIIKSVEEHATKKVIETDDRDLEENLKTLVKMKENQEIKREQVKKTENEGEEEKRY